MTPDFWILGLKALLPGIFVVLFPLLAEMLQPKMFAGLFAGAPVVAAVSLTITAVTKLPAAPAAAPGMIAGAAATSACCAVAAIVVSRSNAWLGSALAWASWAVVALDPAKLREAKARGPTMRFAFGAAIALAAGPVGLRFGHLAGGLSLAFHAVLPASLTLLEKNDGRAKADIDAVRAILGSCGMLAFAVVAAFGLRRLGTAVALGLGAAAWVAVSVGLFFAARFVLDRRV